MIQATSELTKTVLLFNKKLICPKIFDKPFLKNCGIHIIHMKRYCYSPVTQSQLEIFIPTFWLIIPFCHQEVTIPCLKQYLNIVTIKGYSVSPLSTSEGIISTPIDLSIFVWDKDKDKDSLFIVRFTYNKH